MPIKTINIAAGTILAGYRIESELGRGCNGIVFLANQQSLDRHVALKILLPELAAEPGYVENFLHEAQLAARLDHPNIVQAYDTGSTPEGYYFFAMELVNGRPLEEIRRQNPELLTFDLLFNLAIQLADALDYAWNVHKMTHGDIKPGNLLITGDSHSLKLADLGLARISGSASVEDIMATPLYAAPEVIRGDRKEYGVKSDLYSFGIMMYELLCGTPPFVGSPDRVLEQHLNTPPVPLLQRNPDLSPELAALVTELIDKDPDKRPENWQQVRERVIKLRNAGHSVHTRKLERPAAGSGRRFLKAFLIITAILIVLGGIGFLAFLAIRTVDTAPTPIPEAPLPVTIIKPASEPQLTVAISSPAAKEAPPEKKVSPVPEKKSEPDVPAPLPAPKPEVVPPKPVTPTPVPPPQIRKPEPPQEAPSRRRRALEFDPPVNEEELDRQCQRAYRLIDRLPSSFTLRWRIDARKVIEHSYRLLAQLSTQGMKAKVIDRIDIFSSGRGSGWSSNGPFSGTLRLSSNTPPASIAGELGKGFFEAIQQEYKLPNSLKEDFSEAFAYFIARQMGISQEPKFDNRVLKLCNHSLTTFVLMFKSESMLQQLRRRR